jgi:hypothetical protein
MSNSFPKRLALATRGFRGGSSEKTYINEEFTIKEDFENVNINLASTIAVLEDVSVVVDSVIDIGFEVISVNIGVDATIDQQEATIDNF